MHLVGTIDPLPSGRWRFRVKRQGRTRSYSYETREEAVEVQLVVSQRSSKSERETLSKFGETFLDWREASGNRDVRNDRSRWRTHVEGTTLAATPLKEISHDDVELWAEQLRGKVRTRKNALNLVRRCLDRARRLHKIKANPAVGVTIDGKDPEVWTYLDTNEQRVLMANEAIPWADRAMVSFAIATGLRQGEQWALELRDVHLDDGDTPHVIVRWGSKGKPTKTGKVRRVDLVPWVVPILRAWLEALPEFLQSPSGKKTYENEHGLVFPTSRGCYRRDKKPPRAWSKWLVKLDIRGVTGEQVVWHSLRHTCASMLVSGSWGRRWTLQEVAELLGHSSVSTTERYAHLAQGTTARAAAETVPASWRRHGVLETLRATQDSNLRPSVPETLEEGLTDREVAVDVTPDVTRELAALYLRQVREGDPMAIATGLRMAERILNDGSSGEQATERKVPSACAG